MGKQKQGRPVGTAYTGDLSAKVCKYGHEGRYTRRKNGSIACQECMNQTSRKFRAEAGTVKVLSAEEVAQIVQRVIELKKLEVELVAEREELSDKLAKLRREIAQTKSVL